MTRSGLLYSAGVSTHLTVRNLTVTPQTTSSPWKVNRNSHDTGFSLDVRRISALQLSVTGKGERIKDV